MKMESMGPRLRGGDARLSPSDDIKKIAGMGPATAQKFEKLGIHTVWQLLNHIPRRYDDFSSPTKISDIKPGPVNLRGQISDIKSSYARRGLHIINAVLDDGTAKVRLVWFNQPYRAASLKQDATYAVLGEYSLSGKRLVIVSPRLELIADGEDVNGILPIYPETKGLNSRIIQKYVLRALDLLDLSLHVYPESIMRQLHYPVVKEFFGNLHNPKNHSSLETAREDYGLLEVFNFTLTSQLIKSQNQKLSAPEIKIGNEILKSFVESLPFKLTDAQRRVSWQILKDVGEARPMNRLVQGDVGSGKTAVAMMAAFASVKAGYQVSIMAPTEVLARQHFETFSESLAKLDIKIGYLTGSVKEGQKREELARIASGEPIIVIGTQAVIEHNVHFPNLGLVVIDEQHRFGVEQRKKLQAKDSGVIPHLLSMTATPIPRTLALTLYGELDVSVIDELPPGRLPVETQVVSPNHRKSVSEKLAIEVASGRQGYVICPLIDDSEMLAAKSATSEFERLRKDPLLKHVRFGLLHGQLKPAEKAVVLEEFYGHQIDVIISTTVVEVGVSVANATMMIVEGAERFGLAQLHQLRGRVGRSVHQSYCYAMTTQDGPKSQRLRAFESTSDGFKLAELDMEIRGPGAIYGTLQSGALDLKVASLSDVRQISKARQMAKDLVEADFSLSDYPVLMEVTASVRKVVSLN